MTGEKLMTNDLDEIMKSLEDGILQFMDSEKFKDYLKAVSKFHNYSTNNVILISMQKPDASLVAGFNTWKKHFNRHVMKGEKAIRIIAPMPFTVEKEQDRVDQYGNAYKEKVLVTVPRFRAVSVFDVSQTDGDPLPNINPIELKADVNDYSNFLKALINTAVVPVRFTDIEGTAKGYFHIRNNEICIANGMGESQTIKTLIHEIAHSVLHNNSTFGVLLPQKTKEIQAESVAFAVCSHFEIDTSDYTFPYISGWSGEQNITEFRNSMDTIRNAASQLITSIEENYSALTQERLPAEKEKKGIER